MGSTVIGALRLLLAGGCVLAATRLFVKPLPIVGGTVLWAWLGLACVIGLVLARPWALVLARPWALVLARPWALALAPVPGPLALEYNLHTGSVIFVGDEVPLGLTIVALIGVVGIALGLVADRYWRYVNHR